VDRHGFSTGELVVVAAATVLVLFGGVVWGGAVLAAGLAGGSLSASFATAVEAGLRLPGHLGEPAGAWPEPAAVAIPGPWVYWPATALVAAVAVTVVAGALRLLYHRVGTAPRHPLGVDARARFATARDLGPLLVRRAVEGRFVLGCFGRRLVATEVPHRGRGRGRRRFGDRGAVALIGPSRSGKTTAAVGGILEWRGPAVLSSVKADLLSTTYAWRARQGKVLVYDPTGTTGVPTASWSPLREAASVLGAQRAARSLCDAAPRDDNV
jgi:type IV secretion system protein VirD4